MALWDTVVGKNGNRSDLRMCPHTADLGPKPPSQTDLSGDPNNTMNWALIFLGLQSYSLTCTKIQRDKLA